MSPHLLVTLAIAAGFVDTSTFIHLEGLFAAHVTGNFVLLAVGVAQGLAPADALKLAAFPAFISGVVLAERLQRLWPGPAAAARLVLVTSALLLAAGLGIAAWTRLRDSTRLGSADVAVGIMLVIAMGVQNALHRFLPGPPTTVMTGNVVQLTLSLLRRGQLAGAVKAPSLPVQLGLFAAFAGGCIAGALVTEWQGLASAVLPGALLLVTGMVEIRRARRTDTGPAPVDGASSGKVKLG